MKKTLLYFAFFCWLLNDLVTTSADNNATVVKFRQKRALVWVTGGLFKMIVGIGIPVIGLPAKRSLGLSYNFQYQYPVPTNITQLSTLITGVIVARKRRQAMTRQDNSRNVAYQAIEGVLDRSGLDGRECLLRTICEAAESPIGEHNGLLGEFVHEILTPNRHDLPDNFEQFDELYTDAQRAGQNGGDCGSLYSKCRQGDGLLNLISMFDDAIY